MLVQLQIQTCCQESERIPQDSEVEGVLDCEFGVLGAAYVSLSLSLNFSSFFFENSGIDWGGGDR